MKAVLRLAMIAAGAAAVAPPVKAADEAIKIGVLTDLSGLYAAPTGPGSVFAARQAVADFVAAHKGLKVEVVAGDHQNKPDIGAGIANRWIDAEKVDAIVDVPTSSVAFAVNDIVKGKNKVFLASGAAASDLTGARCTPNTVHWTYDTWALANGTGKAIATTGGDSWFFLTADYAFGHALERDTAAVVEANKGKVVGRVRHPLATNDFSSFLMQAQASKAKIVALANAGGDPTMIHAGVYAAVTHYLKAVVALNGAADGKAVVAKMKALPTDDPLFGTGSISRDGRKIHDMYLFEVKRPEESK